MPWLYQNMQQTHLVSYFLLLWIFIYPVPITDMESSSIHIVWASQGRHSKGRAVSPISKKVCLHRVRSEQSWSLGQTDGTLEGQVCFRMTACLQRADGIYCCIVAKSTGLAGLCGSLLGSFQLGSKGTNGMKSQCDFLWSVFRVAHVQAHRAGNLLHGTIHNMLCLWWWTGVEEKLILSYQKAFSLLFIAWTMQTVRQNNPSYGASLVRIE